MTTVAINVHIRNVPKSKSPTIIQTYQREWNETRLLILSKMNAEGITVTQFAELLGENRSQVSKWLRDNFSEPRATIAFRLKDWADNKSI